MSSWALAPYASHHARWKAQPEKGVAHGVRAARRVPGRARDVRDRAALDAQERRRAVEPPVAVSVSGQAGSASRVWEVTPRMLAPSPGIGCGRNLATRGPPGSARTGPSGAPTRLPGRMVGCRPRCIFDCPPRANPLAPVRPLVGRPAPPVPDQRDAALRRAAPDPLDPGQRQVRRLLQQLPADGQLPRHRRRASCSAARDHALFLSPFAPLLLATVFLVYGAQLNIQARDAGEIIFGLDASNSADVELHRPAAADRRSSRR